ncbi:hypothetical protein ACHHYP_16488 [Achlya hypogyna]|uniref:Prolyl 4-hydroxylase alpha subunit domain-containing protein n=1 Tax=Achlya hypogyna TaxID=1202772 RepID=A0A1V9Y6J2_ACHHY|nr:hypothetical protein ACHHYP_16488 [Achlya hypogyna]
MLSTLPPLSHQAVQETHFRAAVQNGTPSPLKNSTELVNGQLEPKYETDLVGLDPQHFLEPGDCADTPAPSHPGRLPVAPVMALPVGALAHNDSVFVMLNGENNGLFIPWRGDSGCVHAVARAAALALGAHPDRVANGVRLVSQYSVPITSARALETANRIVHVLLDFQLWVWPGVALGHTFDVGGVTLRTLSLSPRVFDVAGFFSQVEADAIIAAGEALLRRSVVGESADGEVSAVRTSHSAFLADSVLTRTLQHRAAGLARLPSASFAERLQLVRYAPGEFYRKHHDTMGSKNILPPDAFDRTYDDYVAWATWAGSQLDALGAAAPEGFRRGERLFPRPRDFRHFPNALLELFLRAEPRFLPSRNDSDWHAWLVARVQANAGGTMRLVLQQRPAYLAAIVRVWEEAVNVHSLRYAFSTDKSSNGMSHFLRWIRWVKETVAVLGVNAVPPAVRPAGALYPKFDENFQYTLLALLEEYYEQADLMAAMGPTWFEFLHQYKSRRDCIHLLLQNVPNMLRLVTDAWEAAVDLPALRYTPPAYAKHTNPNRFVTLFLYLNNVTAGGATTFPHVTSVAPIATDDECAAGLSVPARGLRAALFYVLTPDQDIDYLSEHGGCPPAAGQVKWGANSFMWSDDALEGTNFWE